MIIDMYNELVQKYNILLDENISTELKNKELIKELSEMTEITSTSSMPITDENIKTEVDLKKELSDLFDKHFEEMLQKINSVNYDKIKSFHDQQIDTTKKEQEKEQQKEQQKENNYVTPKITLQQITNNLPIDTKQNSVTNNNNNIFFYIKFKNKGIRKMNMIMSNTYRLT